MASRSADLDLEGGSDGDGCVTSWKSAPQNQQQPEEQILHHDTSEDDDDDSFQMIIHGTIVVPTGNPFLQGNSNNNNSTSNTSNTSIQELGPGINLLLDHVMVVNHDGIIVLVEPATFHSNVYSRPCWKDLVNWPRSTTVR
jgi:hypothetical protein